MLKKILLSFLAVFFLLGSSAAPASAQSGESCSFEIRSSGGNVIVPRSKNYSVALSSGDLGPNNEIRVVFFIENSEVRWGQGIYWIPGTREGVSPLERRNFETITDTISSQLSGYREFARSVTIDPQRAITRIGFVNWNFGQLQDGAPDYCPVISIIVNDVCQITEVIPQTSAIDVEIDANQLGGNYVIKSINSTPVSQSDFVGGNNVSLRLGHQLSTQNPTFVELGVFRLDVETTRNNASCTVAFLFDPATLGNPIKISETKEFNLCSQIPETAAQAKISCTTCEESGGIWTALGCIETSSGGIVGSIMSIGLGMAGGIAILMILLSGFEFTVSQGDPKRTSEARDRLAAAVIGLLFILFSVTILRFIGVNLLQIPGFAS